MGDDQDNTQTAEDAAGRIKALEKYGAMPDEKLIPAHAALELSAVLHPKIALERYYNHLDKLGREVTERYTALRDAGAEATPQTRLAALKHILIDKHEYRPDKDKSDLIRNADMIQVIDRGTGNPVALGILYIYAARMQGWDIFGLDLPGYFAVRLDMDGQRLLFDPCNECALLEAADLRRLIKQALGPQAELSADYYEPATNREILIRLQNHIKFRQIESEDYEGALASVQAMLAIDPDEYRLLLDAGVLYARTDQPEQAIAALEDYLGHIYDPRDRQEALYLLQQIKDQNE